MSTPRYRPRPGCNPRTGEPLPPWQQVQVTDPDLPSWSRTPVRFEVESEGGSRLLTLVVPLRPGDDEDVAVDYAQSFGFQVKKVL